MILTIVKLREKEGQRVDSGGQSKVIIIDSFIPVRQIKYNWKGWLGLGQTADEPFKHGDCSE